MILFSVQFTRHLLTNVSRWSEVFRKSIITCELAYFVNIFTKEGPFLERQKLSLRGGGGTKCRDETHCVHMLVHLIIPTVL